MVASLFGRLGTCEGRPIQVRFRPSLRAYRGKLLSGGVRGGLVHAGSDIRRRRIVLDRDLLDDRRELARILVHELFHFVWVRLSNATRRSWEEVLEAEFRRRARGELGWSAESRKLALTAGDALIRSRRWREYACESFCDSAAWLYARAGAHEEFTLAKSFRASRRRWFAGRFGDDPWRL